MKTKMRRRRTNRRDEKETTPDEQPLGFLLFRGERGGKRRSDEKGKRGDQLEEKWREERDASTVGSEVRDLTNCWA